MGLAAPMEQYERAVKMLFPRGEWWDAQLADPGSDASLFARAKAAEIFRFRERMEALWGESRPETADETLGDWERVLLGAPSRGLDKAGRRALLAAASGALNPGAIRETGRLFGVEVVGVSMPFRPAFFGHARFGIDPLAGFAGFSVLVVRARAGGAGARREFEDRARASVLATNIAHFIYEEASGGGNVS